MVGGMGLEGTLEAGAAGLGERKPSGGGVPIMGIGGGAEHTDWLRASPKEWRARWG